MAKKTYKSPKLLETKEWACIAEAVAHYFGRGFQTIDNDCYEERMMRDSTGHEVWIRQEGFLKVKSTLIKLPSY